MPLKPDQLEQAFGALKKTAIFAGCSDPQLRNIAGKLNLLTVAAGKVVLMEQEISKMLYLLAQGSVGIYRRHQGEKVLVATLKAPDFFGEASMFSDSPANALVKAQEPSVLFALPRAAFDQLVASDGVLGLLLERNLNTIEEQRPPAARIQGQEPA
jgi:CRP-like cAMP-binding protein